MNRPSLLPFAVLLAIVGVGYPTQNESLRIIYELSLNRCREHSCHVETATRNELQVTLEEEESNLLTNYVPVEVRVGSVAYQLRFNLRRVSKTNQTERSLTIGFSGRMGTLTGKQFTWGEKSFSHETWSEFKMASVSGAGYSENDESVTPTLTVLDIAAVGPSNDACGLPNDLQQEIASKYPGRTIVSPSDLGEDDKALFQKGHGGSCPGLVKVDFYGDGKPTLALALTTNSVAKGKTELVLAHQVGAEWKTITLATTDGPVPVVWSQKPGEYRDVYGEKKIRATSPVIVFCGYESWAVLYAWTNNRVAKIWLAD